MSRLLHQGVPRLCRQRNTAPDLLKGYSDVLLVHHYLLLWYVGLSHAITWVLGLSRCSLCAKWDLLLKAPFDVQIHLCSCSRQSQSFKTCVKQENCEQNVSDKVCPTPYHTLAACALGAWLQWANVEHQKTLAETGTLSELEKAISGLDMNNRLLHEMLQGLDFTPSSNGQCGTTIASYNRQRNCNRTHLLLAATWLKH